MRRCPRSARCSSTARTARSLSKRTWPGGRGAWHALADADGRHALRDLVPARGERLDRRDDEGVDAAVVQLERELDLERGVAVGVRDQQLPAPGAQMALDAGDELLQVQVGEAADDHAHAGRRPAAQRASDRIGAEAQLLGRRLHARLRLRGHLKAAQRVRHRRRREARVLGQLPDRRSSRARGHVVAVTHASQDVT